MTVTGLTIQEIADKLGIPYGTAAVRLKRAGIKPLLKEDLYPESALEAIREAPMGRPPKKPGQREPEEGGRPRKKQGPGEPEEGGK